MALFHLPVEVEDLENWKEDRLCVKDTLAIDKMTDDARSDIVAELRECLLGGTCYEILEQDSFDKLYSILAYYNPKQNAMLAETADIICTALTKVGKASTSSLGFKPNQKYRDTLKVCTFFLRYYTDTATKALKVKKANAAKAAAVAEKKNKKTKHQTSDSDEGEEINFPFDAVLKSFRSIITLNDCVDTDTFGLLIKTALSILEMNDASIQESSMKNAVQLLAHLVHLFPEFATEMSLCTVLQSLVLGGNATVHIAKLVHVLTTKYNHENLPIELLSEIVAIESNDPAIVKYSALFLEELSKHALDFVQQHCMRLLVPLLARPAYQIRNAVLECVAAICLKSCQTSEDTEHETEENSSGSGVDDKLRNALLELLLERHHDISSYTRSRALKKLSELVEHNAMPVTRLLAVVTVASDRLNDKSSLVRKNALTLLRAVLDIPNLMVGDGKQDAVLSPDYYRSKLDAANAKLAEMQSNLEVGSAKLTPKDAVEDGDAVGRDELLVDFKNEKRVVCYYETLMGLAELMETKAMPAVAKLLGSKQKTDVIASLNFLGDTFELKIPAAQPVLYQAFSLVFSSDTDVRTHILTTFHRIFVEGRSIKDVAAQLISNYVNLSSSGAAACSFRLTEAEEICFGQILIELFESGKLGPETVKCLWGIVSKYRYATSSGSLTVSAARGAMFIISKAAEADAQAVNKPHRLKNMLQTVFGDDSASPPVDPTELSPQTAFAFDFEIASSACTALQNASPQPSPSTQALADRIRDIVLLGGGATQASEGHWYRCAEAAIGALFVLCPNPIQYCAGVVKNMSMALKTAVADATPAGNKKLTLDQHLSHLLFALGHVAMKTLTHAENIAARAKAARLKASAEAATEANTDEDIAKQLGMHASQDHTEDEMLTQIQNNGLLSPQSLFGSFRDLLVHVVKQQNISASASLCNVTLRQSAVLCLCKFMCISRAFCLDHLQLLFTVLEKSKESAVRANIVVSVGDLAFRFPLEFEPWKKHLYRRLTDQDAFVRKNTLMVLSHLILNDMIKIKGHTHEIARCLRDEHPRIRDLAQLFFTEFAAKGDHTIYNILPDTISCLSADDSTTPQVFQWISKHLFAFLKKEWQIENIVEKFCTRMGAVEEGTKTHRDMSFCLGLLNYSDRGLKRLVRCFKLYKNALQNEEVCNVFLGIAQKAKRKNKMSSETATEVEEWQRKLIRTCPSKHAQQKDDCNSDDSEEESGEEEAAVENEERPVPSKTVAGTERQPLQSISN